VSSGKQAGPSLVCGGAVRKGSQIIERLRGESLSLEKEVNRSPRTLDLKIDQVRGLKIQKLSAGQEKREGFLAAEARGKQSPLQGTWYVQPKAPRLRIIDYPGTHRPGYHNFQNPQANNM
jgi:hypothetical protein